MPGLETKSASLRAIDASFLEKYQAVEAGNELAVERCFTGQEAPRS